MDRSAQIETPRLLLRPFQTGDGRDLYEYLSDPAVYAFEPGNPLSEEEACSLAVERSRGTSFWAVVLKSASRMIGHLYFNASEPARLMAWELGYIFNPAFHNQGYASEASRALIEHGFRNMGVHRVVAHCCPQNTASWRVMEKIGMRREGVFRKKILHSPGCPWQSRVDGHLRICHAAGGLGRLTRSAAQCAKEFPRIQFS